MKKVYLLIGAVSVAFIFASCKSNNAKPTPASKTETEQVATAPGSDKDEHGCIGSAGYVWSELKKDCIRPFEAGVKLGGITDENKNFAAYIVFAVDSAKAELFIPGTKEGVVLNQSGDKWANDTFYLTHKDNKWSVSEKGTVLFSD